MKLKTMWRIITTPSCWIRNSRTSKGLSNFINKRLDQGKEIIFINDLKINLDNRILWISNYPYDYGYDYSDSLRELPDRETVFRLKNAIDEARWRE